MMATGTMRSRAMALGLLLLALLLVWFGAAVPYLSALSRSEQQLTATMTQLRNYRRVGAQVTTDQAREQARLAPLFLPGGTPAAAAAQLQQRTGALIADSGAILLSFELLPGPGAEGDPLETITGRIRVTANTPSLRALLHALETERPLLVLDNIFVRGRSSQDTVPGGHLDVQMDVSGYRQAAP